MTTLTITTHFSSSFTKHYNQQNASNFSSIKKSQIMNYAKSTLSLIILFLYTFATAAEKKNYYTVYIKLMKRRKENQTKKRRSFFLRQKKSWMKKAYVEISRTIFFLFIQFIDFSFTWSCKFSIYMSLVILFYAFMARKSFLT